jgi:hypothetical protein
LISAKFNEAKQKLKATSQSLSLTHNQAKLQTKEIDRDESVLEENVRKRHV